MRRPVRPFLAPLVVLALTCCTILGARLFQRREIAYLNRQLSLAQTDRNVGSVREVARRIGRLDKSPRTRLRVAEIFLSLDLMDDFWGALRLVENDSPERAASIERLRAKGLLAANRKAACVTSLQRFLRMPGLSPEQKVDAFDDLAAAQCGLGRWNEARAALDERLALADAPAPRLKRARVLARAGRWAEVRGEFALLARTDASAPDVKELMPRWERAGRGLAGLPACDDALNAAPNALKPRLDRARVEARLGLWQNAADDLQQAVSLAPMTRARLLRLPLVLGARLGMKTTKEGMELEDAQGAELTNVPWLAPGASLQQLNDLARAEDWQQLEDVDLEIAGDPAGWADRSRFAGLLATQAEIELKLGSPRRALADANEVLKQMPGFLPARQVEIAALLATDDLPEAEAETERAVRENTDTGGHVPASLGVLAGYVWQRQGRHRDAVEAFSACLDVARSADILRARAKSLRFLQRFAEADHDAAEADALAAPTAREAAP